MWNTPQSHRLAKIPRLYETEDIQLNEKLVYLHFHILDSEWFAVEYDGRDRFFGFAILNSDTINAEWGYFSFQELKELAVGPFQVTCTPEREWQIRPAQDVGIISLAMCWGKK